MNGAVIGLVVKVLIGCCLDPHVHHISSALFNGTDPFILLTHTHFVFLFCLYAHRVTSSSPPGQLLLLQRTLLSRTSALWDGGSSCHSNYYVMAPSCLVSDSVGGVTVKFHLDFDVEWPGGCFRAEVSPSEILHAKL